MCWVKDPIVQNCFPITQISWIITEWDRGQRWEGCVGKVGGIGISLKTVIPIACQKSEKEPWLINLQ